jgi:hypothetical protein
VSLDYSCQNCGGKLWTTTDKEQPTSTTSSSDNGGVTKGMFQRVADEELTKIEQTEEAMNDSYSYAFGTAEQLNNLYLLF